MIRILDPCKISSWAHARAGLGPEGVAGGRGRGAGRWPAHRRGSPMTWGEGARAGAAVVIGVGEYLHAERVRPLRFAALDARSVAEVLIDPAVCGFPADRVRLLTDADAGRDAVAH